MCNYDTSIEYVLKLISVLQSRLLLQVGQA